MFAAFLNHNKCPRETGWVLTNCEISSLVQLEEHLKGQQLRHIMKVKFIYHVNDTEKETTEMFPIEDAPYRQRTLRYSSLQADCAADCEFSFVKHLKS